MKSWSALKYFLRRASEINKTDFEKQPHVSCLCRFGLLFSPWETSDVISPMPRFQTLLLVRGGAYGL